MYPEREDISVSRWLPKANMRLEIEDIEYTDVDRAYIRVEGFDIRIIRTDEGIVVDIFDPNDSGDMLGSTYAYDNELVGENDE